MKYQITLVIAFIILISSLIAETAISTPISSNQSFYDKVLTKAKSGDALAQYEIAAAYEEGEGVEINDSLSTYWYMKSATNGNDMAQVNLGYRYRLGLGTPKNDSLAFYWFKKGAEQNNSDGLFDLGYCYEKGIGTKQNFKEAAKMYLKASEMGNCSAMASLGDLYVYGAGVKADNEEAYFWLFLSYEMEFNEGTRQNLANAKEKLTKDEIKEIEKRAETWRTKHKL